MVLAWAEKICLLETKCSRCGNGDRMHVILNVEPLEEVDCFKYLRSQVAADGSERDVVHRLISLGSTEMCAEL